jgi:hypothetical protein
MKVDRDRAARPIPTTGGQLNAAEAMPRRLGRLENHATVRERQDALPGPLPFGAPGIALQLLNLIVFLNPE